MKENPFRRVLFIHQSNCAAESNDTCLVKHALLEMRHQVGGHEREAFRIANQRRDLLFVMRQVLVERRASGRKASLTR